MHHILRLLVCCVNQCVDVIVRLQDDMRENILHMCTIQVIACIRGGQVMLYLSSVTSDAVSIMDHFTWHNLLSKMDYLSGSLFIALMY